MRPDGFIATYGWMIDLGLTLAERTVYGLIHGITYDGVHTFHGSMEYIGEWCGISARSVRRILGRLVEQGLIIREDHLGQASTFRVNPDFLPLTPAKMSAPDKLATLPRPTCPPTPANLSAHNNIENNIDNNINTLSTPRAREDKVLYGDCVLLTASEHDKLVAEFGADDTARLISILDLYLANKTKDPYKSHYAAIKKWVVRDLAEQKTAEQRLKNAQEAGQRVNAQHAPATGFGAGLADANRRFKEITDKYKN